MRRNCPQPQLPTRHPPAGRLARRRPKRTHLTDWPAEKVDSLRRVGQRLVCPEEAFTRSLPHGHVDALLAMIRRLDRLIAPKRLPERDRVLAMDGCSTPPRSSLPPPPPRRWHTTTLAQELDLGDADEDALYEAMDWLLVPQERIDGIYVLRTNEPAARLSPQDTVRTGIGRRRALVPHRDRHPGAPHPIPRGTPGPRASVPARRLPGMASAPRLGAAAVRRRDPGRRPAHPRPPSPRPSPPLAPGTKRHPGAATGPFTASIPCSANSRPAAATPVGSPPPPPGPVCAHRADIDSALRRTPHVPSTGNSRKLKLLMPINQLNFVTPRELRFRIAGGGQVGVPLTMSFEFLVIGAGRSGTSLLAGLLDSHSRLELGFEQDSEAILLAAGGGGGSCRGAEPCAFGTVARSMRSGSQNSGGGTRSRPSISAALKKMDETRLKCLRISSTR